MRSPPGEGLLCLRCASHVRWDRWERPHFSLSPFRSQSSLRHESRSWRCPPYVGWCRPHHRTGDNTQRHSAASVYLPSTACEQKPVQCPPGLRSEWMGDALDSLLHSFQPVTSSFLPSSCSSFSSPPSSSTRSLPLLQLLLPHLVLLLATSIPPMAVQWKWTSFLMAPSLLPPPTPHRRPPLSLPLLLLPPFPTLPLLFSPPICRPFPPTTSPL